MRDGKTEILLVLLAQTGDKDALNKLLGSIQTPVYRYIYRLIEDESLAEDILQEVFIIIYRKIGWLNEPNLFRAWVYRIASREAFRHLKRERKWREQIRDEEVLGQITDDPGEPEYGPELVERLPQLLSEVSPASRAVLMLHYLDEMSLAETAEILGIGSGTAKSRLAYGLQTIRQKLKIGK